MDNIYLGMVDTMLSEQTVLEQLAEKSAELGKAALEHIRAKGYTNNWTPKDADETLENIEEDLMGVLMCAYLLEIHIPTKDEIKKCSKWGSWAGRIDRYNAKQYAETAWTPEIAEATLLSVAEAKALPVEIRICKPSRQAIDDGAYVNEKSGTCWWWLRSPGYNSNIAAIVNYDGSVFNNGNGVSFSKDCVRPALKIKNLKSLNLQIGDKVRIFDQDFIVISEDKVLSAEAVGAHAFRFEEKADNANIYEASDVKQYVERWLSEQMAQLLRKRDTKGNE